MQKRKSQRHVKAATARWRNAEVRAEAEREAGIPDREDFIDRREPFELDLRSAGYARLRAELLALLLRTGIQGKGVLQMAHELLQLKKDSTPGNENLGFGGISGLLHATADDLKRVKGLGPAKRSELVAVLELARRAMAQQLKEREVFATPEAVKHYLQLHLSGCLLLLHWQVLAILLLLKLNSQYHAL